MTETSTTLLPILAHAYVIDGECEEMQWGGDIAHPDDPTVVRLVSLSAHTHALSDATRDLTEAVEFAILLGPEAEDFLRAWQEGSTEAVSDPHGDWADWREWRQRQRDEQDRRASGK